MANRHRLLMENKIKELENKIIDLTNDMNTIKSNNGGLFRNKCKLCSKEEQIYYSMTCPNNSKLGFLVCKSCYDVNKKQEEEKECGYYGNDHWRQGFFLNGNDHWRQGFFLKHVN